MVETSDINVKVNNKSECVYKDVLKNEGNNLPSLITNLKLVQQRVNEILTKLVQAEQNDTSNEAVDDSINDDDEEADEDDDDDDDSDDVDDNFQIKKFKQK